MRLHMYVKRDDKTGIYKYRRNYPEDIARELGKRTFIKSFRTKDRRVADSRYSAVEQEYLRITEAPHTSHADSNKAKVNPSMVASDFLHSTLPQPLLPSPSPTHHSNMKLTEAHNRWKADNSHVASRSLSDWQLAVDRFIGLFGDLDIALITSDHIQEYCDLLLKLPRNIPAKFRDKTVRELTDLHITGAINSPLLSSRTVQKMRNILSSVFQNAIKNKRLSITNPVAAVTVKVTSRKRVRFTDDDLHKIFGTARYAINPLANTSASPAALKELAYFWLPILGLFTGARLEELGQLELSDIITEYGVKCFSINDWNEHKNTKTDSSVRKVPIHYELIRLGFLDYVDLLIYYKHSRIFPALTKSRDGRYTKVFSQSFGRYIEKLNIRQTGTRERKDFHSFRHTFKTMLRLAKVENQYQNALLGHENPGMGDVYGDFPPEALNPELQKVVSPIDLSHLHFGTRHSANLPSQSPVSPTSSQTVIERPVSATTALSYIHLAEAYNRIGKARFSTIWQDYRVCLKPDGEWRTYQLQPDDFVNQDRGRPEAASIDYPAINMASLPKASPAARKMHEKVMTYIQKALPTGEVKGLKRLNGGMQLKGLDSDFFDMAVQEDDFILASQVRVGDKPCRLFLDPVTLDSFINRIVTQQHNMAVSQ